MEQDVKPLIDDKDDFNENYRHYEQLMVRKIQHFYLSSPIDEPIFYVDMIHRIQTAGPEDIIYIHLNTPGGQLDTGVQLVNAMQSTPAHVIVGIEAEAHSLGTLIFLAADEFVVHDNVMMMIHNYSGGVFGKAHEQAARLEGTMKWFNALARRIYIPFLSEEEFEKVLEGGDLYLHSADIRKRLERMVKKNKKDQKVLLNAVKKKYKKKKQVA